MANRFAATEQQLWRYYGLRATKEFVRLRSTSTRVRLISVGAGEPLLFIHGGGSYAAEFAPLVAGLADQHRCLLFDRPGCGLSDAFSYRGVDLRTHAIGVVAEVVENFGLEAVPIVGHSMGGHWALWFSVEHPRRVTSLILPGVPGYVLSDALPRWLRYAVQGWPLRVLMELETLLMPAHAAVGRMSMRALGHSSEALAALPAALPRLEVLNLKRRSNRRSTATLGERLLDRRGLRPGVLIGPKELSRVSAPTLLLWGARDPTGAPELGSRIAQTLPWATLVRLEAGHMPWFDQPDRCASLVRQHLQSPLSRPAAAHTFRGSPDS